MLMNYLRDAGIEETRAARAKTFFNQCLVVRYGGIPGGFTREEMIRECRDIIKMLGE
jgi:hypothetical protein